jgi:hypothetical protein
VFFNVFLDFKLSEPARAYHDFVIGTAVSVVANADPIQSLLDLTVRSGLCRAVGDSGWENCLWRHDGFREKSGSVMKLIVSDLCVQGDNRLCP